MERLDFETGGTMKIAVSDTGKVDKQKLYLDWLQGIEPEAELHIVSYRENNIQLLNECDGLVLTGGEDVVPAKSHAKPVELVGETDILRDEFEFQLLEKAIQKEIPILGICRGLQVGNVFLGGTLHADLQNDGFQKHDTKEKEPIVRHSVNVVHNSLLEKIVGSTSGDVNSYHHQAAKLLSPLLSASSFSSDNVIESLEWKEKSNKPYLLFVQWHPERMNDGENPFSKNIGKSFFEAVKEFNQRTK